MIPIPGVVEPQHAPSPRKLPMKKPTVKQGQYLAYIFYYTKMNGRAPAEADMEHYFRFTPPSVHQMILTLEANGFIERTLGVGRSIRLLVRREELPELV